MLCEYAYYKTDDKSEKPCCNNPQKLKEDDFFKERCPFIYFCTVSERFENTVDITRCIYRRNSENDRQ